MKTLKILTVSLPNCSVTKTAASVETQSNAALEAATKKFASALLAGYFDIPVAAVAKRLAVYIKLVHGGGVELQCKLGWSSDDDDAGLRPVRKREIASVVGSVYRGYARWCSRARQGVFADVRPAALRAVSESGDDIIWVDAENASTLMKTFNALVKEIQADERYRAAKLRADQKSLYLAIALPPTARITEALRSKSVKCRGRVVSVDGDKFEAALDCRNTTGGPKAMIIQYGDLVSRVGTSVHETIADAVKYPGEKDLLFVGYQLIIKDVGGHRVQSQMLATGLEVIPSHMEPTEAQARQIRGTEVDDADARGASKRKTPAVGRTATPKGSRGHRRPKTPVQTSHDGHSAP